MVVFLDYELPGGNGVQIVDIIATLELKKSKLMLFGNSSDPNNFKTVATSLDNNFTKNIFPDNLVQRITGFFGDFPGLEIKKETAATPDRVSLGVSEIMQRLKSEIQLSTSITEIAENFEDSEDELELIDENAQFTLKDVKSPLRSSKTEPLKDFTEHENEKAGESPLRSLSV